jgi:hypothetical protein
MKSSGFESIGRIADSTSALIRSAAVVCGINVSAWTISSDGSSQYQISLFVHVELVCGQTPVTRAHQLMVFAMFLGLRNWARRSQATIPKVDE